MWYFHRHCVTSFRCESAHICLTYSYMLMCVEDQLWVGKECLIAYLQYSTFNQRIYQKEKGLILLHRRITRKNLHSSRKIPWGVWWRNTRDLGIWRKGRKVLSTGKEQMHRGTRKHCFFPHVPGQYGLWWEQTLTNSSSPMQTIWGGTLAKKNGWKIHCFLKQ